MNTNKIIVYFSESKTLATNLSMQTNIPCFELKPLVYSFGEFSVVIPDIPLQSDIYFVIQNVGEPTKSLMHVFMALDALENKDPLSVNLVVPYLPFSRQDRKKGENRAVASRVLGKLFNTSKVDKIYTFDLHNPVIIDYFTSEVINLSMLDDFVTYFASLALEDVVIVAPDHGRFNAARYVADAFNASFVLINKMRDEEGGVYVTSIEGDTNGKTALIIEDIIDTGTTLVSAVTALKAQGVKAVYVAATHGVFSGNALKSIKALGLKNIIITNTIPQHIIDPLVVVLPIENHLVKIMHQSE